MTGRSRGPAVALGTLWPTGAVLAVAHQEVTALTTPVFLVLDVAYVVAATVLLLRLGAHRRGPLVMLAAAPVALFAIGGLTGAPTGEEPDLLAVNTAILLAVAVVLALSGTSLVLRHRRSPATGFAAAAVVLLLLGTAGYLVNLGSRFAVVLTGLSERQATLEDRYWVAAEHLRGLPPSPDLLAYLLTWMDLVQIGYVAAAYVAAAGLARLLGAERVVAPRTGRVVEACAWAGAGLLIAATALAAVLPRDRDAAPAGVAYALSIPFMTTLLPFVLAVTALARAASARVRPSRRPRAGTPPARPWPPASRSLA